MRKFLSGLFVFFLFAFASQADPLEIPIMTGSTLFETETNVPNAGCDPIPDGAEADLDFLTALSLDIQANTEPPVVGSVRLGLNEQTNHRVQKVVPYAPKGDRGAYPWIPVPGETILTATPFSKVNATGIEETPCSIRFAVTQSRVSSPLSASITSVSPVFLEQDGLVVVEIESVAPTIDWRVETQYAGYTGTSYYAWRGPNLFAQPGVGVLTYRVWIANPGKYHFRIRNYHVNPDVTMDNDCWVQLNEGPWIKSYSHLINQWNWQTRFEFQHTHWDPEFDLAGGLHTIRISGRSNGFMIDRFHLFQGWVNNPLSTDHPQSNITSVSSSYLQIR